MTIALLTLTISATSTVTPASQRDCLRPPSPPCTATPRRTEGSTASPDAILGTWNAPDRTTVVTIRRSGASFVGVVATAKKDPVVGTPLFRNLVWDAGHARWTGEVFAPKRNAYVSATFTLKGTRTLSMTAGSFNGGVREIQSRRDRPTARDPQNDDAAAGSRSTPPHRVG